MENLQILDSIEMNLPLELGLWEKAQKQAKRSTLATFKTGCIIFDKEQKILSRGCSHHPEWTPNKTRHAEEDAIYSAFPSDIRNAYILIVTIGRAGNFSYTSRPCVSCVLKMIKAEISLIYYAEKENNGCWRVNVERPSELLARVENSEKRIYEFAKMMRIPNVML